MKLLDHSYCRKKYSLDKKVNVIIKSTLHSKSKMYIIDTFYVKIVGCKMHILASANDVLGAEQVRAIKSGLKKKKKKVDVQTTYERLRALEVF